VEVVVTTEAISHAKHQKCRHQQTNTQVFLQAGCPSCRPHNSVKALPYYTVRCLLLPYWELLHYHL